MILVCRHRSRPPRELGPSIHQPVLLEEVLELLRPQRGGFFVDATVGGGGHAEALLRAAPELQLLALDRDAEALARARRRLAPFGDRVQYAHAPFSALERQLPGGWGGKLAGVLADFGVSSDQLEDRERGFSFQEDGPLDMRMDATKQKTSAAKLLASATEDQIEQWLHDYGEERYARRIAHGITEARRRGPILRTSQLAELVRRLTPGGHRGLHPATRTFQALRIAVNSELVEVDALLETVPALLAPGGIFVAISFHSLEDRRVKQAFRNEARSGLYRILTPKGIPPAAAEVRRNPRARSSRLRALQRTGGES